MPISIFSWIFGKMTISIFDLDLVSCKKSGKKSSKSRSRYFSDFRKSDDCNLRSSISFSCFSVWCVSGGSGEAVGHECRLRGRRFGVRPERVRREEEGLGRRLRQEGPSAGRAGGHFRYDLAKSHCIPFECSGGKRNEN